MANIYIEHEYSGIAPYYEQWSSGDAAYTDTQRFYVDTLTQFQRGNFLELGIGTGRISLEVLQKVPVTITGIDRCREMLSECQHRYEAIHAQLVGTLLLQQADFCDFGNDKLNFFDGVMMPFRTIGHLLTDDQLNAMLQSVFRVLKAGGWFLFDHYMFQYAWAECHNNVDILMYQDSDLIIQDRYKYDFSHARMHCSVSVNGKVCESFDFRWFPKEHLEMVAQKAGFQVVKVCGEFDGRPWTEDSLEQIWLLKKPGVSIQLPVFGSGVI